MKQVICINDKEWGDVCDCPHKDDTCVVTREFLDESDDNDPCYELEGYDGWFSQRYFKTKEDGVANELEIKQHSVA